MGPGGVARAELALALEGELEVRGRLAKRGEGSVERREALGRHMQPRDRVEDHALLPGREVCGERQADLDGIVGPDRGRVRRDHRERRKSTIS